MQPIEMAYDEGLAERLREVFSARKDVTEKKMFGGIAFMVSGNMCCGVVNDTLMARVGPDQYKASLKRPHAREMNFTGKPMKGFVYVAPEGFESDDDMADWVGLCLDFVAMLPAK
jgi:TfoX/Sxy family transcriptional regulator of competence genes